MKKNYFKNYIVIIILTLISCSDKKDELVGDWEMYDMADQTYYKKSVKMFSSDYAVQEYLKKAGNTEFIEEYNNYTKFEKEKFRKNLEEQLYLKGQKSWSKFHEGGFVSFYKDNNFSFYFYPYYFIGTYSIIDNNNIKLLISKKSSIVAYDIPLEESYKSLILEYNSIDDKSFFVIRPKEFPTIWELDTLYVNKKRNQSMSKIPKNNEWRFEIESPKERLKSHIDYLIKVFEDALMNREKRLNINSEFNCSPLKFYGNGVMIRGLKDKKLNCWKSLFKNENDFLEAYYLLDNSFGKYKPKLNKNRFKMNIEYLNSIRNSL